MTRRRLPLQNILIGLTMLGATIAFAVVAVSGDDTAGQSSTTEGTPEATSVEAGSAAGSVTTAATGGSASVVATTVASPESGPASTAAAAPETIVVSSSDAVPDVETSTSVAETAVAEANSPTDDDAHGIPPSGLEPPPTFEAPEDDTAQADADSAAQQVAEDQQQEAASQAEVWTDDGELVTP